MNHAVAFQNSKTALERHHGQETELVCKHLSQGKFRWPPVVDGAMRLSAVEFAALFDGLDWTRVQATKRIPTPTAAA